MDFEGRIFQNYVYLINFKQLSTLFIIIIIIHLHLVFFKIKNLINLNYN
jgi:hypothetical protein